jgi:hypothetical protein
MRYQQSGQNRQVRLWIVVEVDCVDVAAVVAEVELVAVDDGSEV